MFKQYIDKMIKQYNEQINVKNAKFLLSCDEDKLKELIDPNDDKFENGEKLFTNYETYVKQLKQFLKQAISQMESKGYIEREYSSSKNQVNQGRIYVKKFGVQKLKRNIRGFLIKDYVKDLDMINAHPSILLNLLKTTYPELKDNYETLELYVNNRDYFIKEKGISKMEVLISMNSSTNIKSTNQLFCKLDKEFKVIQKILFNDYPNKVELTPITLSIKAQLKQNKFGKFLNHILCVKENEILQKVMNIYKDIVQTPMFDGFTIKNTVNSLETISKLNQLTLNDGVKWSEKEHDNEIIYDENVAINYVEIKGYKQQKIEFEKTHFLIENPLLYGRSYTIKGEDKYQFYGKEKFKELTKPIKYFDEYTEDFFPAWLEDSTRRSYKEIKFVPKLEDDDEIFNSFKGFNYDGNTDEEEHEVIEVFKNHISLLTSHEEKSIEYLEKYIAHLIQKPEEKPATAIMLKGKQGFGKDTLIDYISDLIGISHVFRTAEIDDIFGTYNVGIRDRLLIQLNELEGKDGFSNKEKIKNIITEDETIIREKYISQYSQPNYLRVFILSNNLNPIDIPHDDRRFNVFKAYHKKPSKEYFEKLHGFRKDKNAMNCLMKYFKNMDISNFNPRTQRPITSAYENMKQHNQNPFYKYMYDNFIKEGYKNNFESSEYKKHKSNGNIYVKSNNLFQNYKEFLMNDERGYMKPTFKLMKSILNDIGIDKKQVKISGLNSDWYIINIEDLKEQLEDHNLEDEVLEFEDDEFEDCDEGIN